MWEENLTTREYSQDFNNSGLYIVQFPERKEWFSEKGSFPFGNSPWLWLEGAYEHVHIYTHIHTCF